MEQIIQTITWEKILDLFQQAKHRIIVVMPAIHDGWAQAIIQLNATKLKKPEIWICINNQEKAYRSGYGDIESIKKLLEAGAFIKQSEKLTIGFLCVDDQAWSFHFESTIISGDPEGPNTIVLNEQITKNILQSIFPEKFAVSSEINKIAITEPLYETRNQESSIAVPLDITKAMEITEILKINPPTEPDLQRQVNTYITLFQYAEMQFEGCNISSQSINIPSELNSFMDETLIDKTKTRLTLFTKEETEKWKELIEIRELEKEIRKNYLVPCSLRKDKSILIKERKNELLNAINNLKELIEKNKINLQNRIQTELNKTNRSLREGYRKLILLKPPDSIANIKSPEDKEYLIESEISEIFRIKKIHFPTASTLISRMKINCFFSELTWEDINDDEFISWFHQKNLINSKNKNKIANFSKAYEFKREY